MQNMYKKEYSEMLSIFYGIHVSSVVSKARESKEPLSICPEPFSVISLSIPDKNNAAVETSIFDCFDLYCKPEQIVWINENTKQKEIAERSMSFWSLPEIMIIDLKRWNGHKSKQNQLVTVPLSNVNFSTYISGYHPESYVYDLYGVCNHSGGVLGGHYTSYIKNANGKWYEFNDTFVNEMKEEQVISPRSYCLFYRKKK